MEVAHLAERTVNHLSSGESRRLLIARALAHQPRALVLDEPTNSLDLRACRDLTASLRRLAQAGHQHHPGDAPSARHHPGDRTRRRPQGRPRLRDGPTAEVLTRPVLTDVFGVAVEVVHHGDAYVAFTP